MFEFYKEIYDKYGGIFSEYSFVDVYFQQDNRCFGNSILELESTVLKFRFIKDRGQSFLEIGHKSNDEWLYISKVAKVYFDIDIGSLCFSANVIDFVKSNLNEMTRLFSKKEYKS